MLVTRSFDLIELFITIMLYGFAIFRAVSGAMTAGEVVAFVMYFSRIQYAVLGISDIIASILSRAPMWQQLFDFLDIPDEAAGPDAEQLLVEPFLAQDLFHERIIADGILGRTNASGDF